MLELIGVIEIDMKLKSRYVKAKVIKTRVRNSFRLPRKAKKRLNNAFGPNAYKAWRINAFNRYFHPSVEFGTSEVNVSVTQDMLDDLRTFNGIDIEYELSMLLREHGID